MNDTIYKEPEMTGASSNANGTRGIVPAPASGKQGTFLRGDGTWAEPIAITEAEVNAICT